MEKKLFCFCSFLMFFLDFRLEITEKGLKLTIKVENGSKEVFQPASGCMQHPKAGRNTQQKRLTW